MRDTAGCECTIAMEGARYVQTSDGSVRLYPHDLSDQVGYALLGAMGLVFLGVTMQCLGVALQGVLYGLGGCSLVLFLAYVLYSLPRPPHIVIHPRTNIVDIAHGRPRQQVPFAAVTHISLTSSSRCYEIGEGGETREVEVFEISLGLHSQEPIVCGVVADRQSAHQDALTIARMIARTMGVPLCCRSNEKPQL